MARNESGALAFKSSRVHTGKTRAVLSQHPYESELNMEAVVNASQPAARYVVPGWFTRRMFNPLVAVLARRGIGVRGSNELSVLGRTSGEWRRVPVNPLDFEGSRYLVAPRGTTQWVRNLRAAGCGQLRVGRRTESFDAHEVSDADKVAILRSYLKH